MTTLAVATKELEINGELIIYPGDVVEYAINTTSVTITTPDNETVEISQGEFSHRYRELNGLTIDLNIGEVVLINNTNGEDALLVMIVEKGRWVFTYFDNGQEGAIREGKAILPDGTIIDEIDPTIIIPITLPKENILQFFSKKGFFYGDRVQPSYNLKGKIVGWEYNGVHVHFRVKHRKKETLVYNALNLELVSPGPIRLLYS